jgi:hypothetical protein
LDKALVEARELCKAAGENFKAFQEKFAPQYKRSRLYQVLAIADGRTTVEDVRQGEREKKRRQRARPGQNDVPDKAAEGEEATDKKPRPMEEAVAELRARAKGLGYSLRWRVTKAGGAAFRLIDKNGNPVADSIVGVIELLDEYEGNKTAGEAPTEEPQSEAASSEDAEPTPPTDTVRRVTSGCWIIRTGSKRRASQPLSAARSRPSLRPVPRICASIQAKRRRAWRIAQVRLCSWHRP